MLCSHLPTDSILAGKIPIRRLVKKCQIFYHRGSCQIYYYKDKNATLNVAHLGQRSKVACLKCFEKLKVMNYRSKVLESPTKNPWSDRPTLKACLGHKHNIFPMPAIVLYIMLYSPVCSVNDSFCKLYEVCRYSTTYSIMLLYCNRYLVYSLLYGNRYLVCSIYRFSIIYKNIFIVF